MYTTVPAAAAPATVSGYPAATAPRTYVTMSSGAMPAGATVVRQVVPGQTIAAPQVIRSSVPTTAGQPVTYVTQPVAGQAGPVQTVVRTVAPGQQLSSTVRAVATAPGVPANAQYVTYSSGAIPAGPRVVQTVGGQPYYIGQYSQHAFESKHAHQSEDAELKKLKDIRRNCGLKNVPVGEGLKALKEAAVDDKLFKDQFLEAYRSLLQRHGQEIPDEKTQNAVFDLFDRDDNGCVDMMELICGIALLCQGTEDDKIQAVFNIFDENGDGFISMDEMFKFLTAVFKVVLTPNVMGVMRSMGVEVESAEDLASVTSLECFKAADLNNDGKLSLQEFHNWFYAPKNDPSFLFSPVRKLLQ